MSPFYPIIAVLLLLIPTTVLAHPETGMLPDAIAETEYKIVLEITPRDCATRNKLGIVLFRKNKLLEAAQQFKEVLKIAPRDFDAHDGLALVRLKELKYAEALGWAQKAIAINSEDTQVYHTLGQALEQLGQLKEAEAAYRKGLEVNNRNLSKALNRDAEIKRRDLLQTTLKGLQARYKSR